ncbi:TonB-dependent receptor [Brucella gallinifaecis]|uniref:TonB-dependent receptor n=1 Tax=Brucella gallinifaecis TaxID=215590 RepID=UPI002360ACA1|nr:TonB-dependent receptor [Brucella gallinifaecis]
MTILRVSLACFSTLSASFVAAGVAEAQEKPPAEQGTIVLEPITITARKRSESAAEVPLSLNVIVPEDLLKGSIDQNADIARDTPNFNFVNFGGPGGNFGTMRGIGPLGSPLNSLDNTIGFSVDGIPTSSFGFAPTLMDFQQVEVLRGPQGTLFGRNALAGAVNVVNNPADGKREFSLTGEVGTDGYRILEGIAGGWLLPDRLAGRGVLRFENFDGDIPNPVIGRDEGAAKVSAGRGTLTFTPDATLNISVTGGFDFDKRTDPLYLWKEHPDFPVSGVDLDQYAKRDMGYGSLTISKEFDLFMLTSVTGYQHIKVETLTDDTEPFLNGAINGVPPGDFIDPDADWGLSTEREKIFTQEVRLNSLEGEEISWVGGLSYFRSNYNMDRNQESTFFPSLNGTNNTNILSQTWAAFGDVSVPLNDRLTLSGGLRVAHDKQDMDSLYVSNGFSGTVPSFAQDRSFDDTYVTGRAALSWKWNDEVLSYASVARGYSSGGFERYTSDAYAGIVANPFKPATMWTYEIGTKAKLFDDRLDLSASVFYNDVSNGQVATFDPSTFLFVFANQDLRSYGFEAQGKLALDQYWKFAGGIGVTKSELVNVPADASTGARDGYEAPNAPELTANLGIEYARPLSVFTLDGTVTASANYQYVGSRQADIQNSFKLDSYHLVNAQVGFEAGNRSVYVFARNIFDERPQFFGATFTPTAHSLMIGRGRVLGLGASMKW